MRGDIHAQSRTHWSSVGKITRSLIGSEIDLTSEDCYIGQAERKINTNAKRLQVNVCSKVNSTLVSTRGDRSEDDSKSAPDVYVQQGKSLTDSLSRFDSMHNQKQVFWYVSHHLIHLILIMCRSMCPVCAETPGFGSVWTSSTSSKIVDIIISYIVIYWITL